MKKRNVSKEDVTPGFSKEDLVSEEKIWSVIEFARSYAGSGYLTPELVNARMRDTTLNPAAASQAELETALLNPKASEAKIQAFSQSFEITNMPYKRLLGYLGNMLSWDITYSCRNAKAEDFSKPRYKLDLATAEAYLDRFNYSKEFSVAVREMLRNDAYFACPVDTGDKVVLQELPPDYCKITGRWENGFLFSFNMYYFLLPGVDINMYPKFFKKKYNEIWGKGTNGLKYNPALAPDAREGSSWIYWVDVPVDVGWCFKMNLELATRLPYFTPLFSDLVLQGLMRNLQKNINMSAASRMIVGEVPMLNKEAKATVADSIAISPELLGKFLALVKSAISESIKMASAPLTNMQGISFPAENEMYDSYLRTTLATSGVNSNLIFSSNIKPNAIETQLSLNVDEQLMVALYKQFNEFIDYQVNSLTRYYKFAFEFEGTEFFTNRNKRLEDALSLFDKGVILPHKIAAAMGMKPATLRRQMEEAKASGFMDLLTPPNLLVQESATNSQLKIIEKQGEITEDQNKANAAQQLKVASLKTKTVGKLGDEGGRPKKKDSALSESGSETRGDAGNVGRGGKSGG